jgi:hypothetical protein
VKSGHEVSINNFSYAGKLKASRSEPPVHERIGAVVGLDIVCQLKRWSAAYPHVYETLWKIVASRVYTAI